MGDKRYKQSEAEAKHVYWGEQELIRNAEGNYAEALWGIRRRKGYRVALEVISHIREKTSECCGRAWYFINECFKKHTFFERKFGKRMD
ncbi:MAG: hypothetical protein QXF56_04085 [Candidatus Micrarchaeia archaeon]